MSGPYRGGWDEDRRRDGGQGSGGYPQQDARGQQYTQPAYDQQAYDQQAYDQQAYDQQAYDQQAYDQQAYDQQGRGERARWDDAGPAFGGDPYDRGYGQPGGGAGQPDPRQARPAAQPGGYGTGPRREQPGGSARSGGYAQQGGGSFRDDPARSGPDQVQGGTGGYPRAGSDPRDSGGYRTAAGERPGEYGFEGRSRWGDHDQFLPGFEDGDGQRDYGRGDRRPASGQAPGAGRDERYGGGYGHDGQYDDGQYAGSRYEDDHAERGGRGGRGGRGETGGTRPPKRKRGPVRMLAPWVALLVILAAVGSAGLYGYRYVQNKQHPADYVGAGVGPAVLVQVKSGDTATSLAPALLADGVIKSTRAFVLAAEHSASTAGLEAGFFNMNRQMQASLAYAYLLNPKNRVQGTVTIPEGKRLSQILAILVKAHPKITMADYQAVLKNPAQLGLPAYAGGKPEGYLFPSTYIIQPNDTALTVLKAMVAQYNQHAAVFNLPKTAPAVGMTAGKIIIAASLIQAEAGRNADMGKIAEVLYRRLNMSMPLQFDSTVLYGLGRYGTTATNADTHKAGPYNTYMNQGLPPGPIDSPGDLAIQAALHPEHGNLLYFRGCADKDKVTLFSPVEVPPVSLCPKP